MLSSRSSLATPIPSSANRAMTMKPLFTLTAAIEMLTGIGLVAAPSVLVRLLLGVPLEAPAAHVVAGLAGAALLSIGLACWLARDDGASRAGRALLAAITLYNIAAVALLTFAGLGLGLNGLGLWPAVILHGALTLWCVACLRINRAGR